MAAQQEQGQQGQQAPARVDAQREAWWKRLLLRVGTAAGVQRVAVSATVATVTVRFALREQDARYGVLATPTWNTTVWVTAQTAEGCTLNFGTAPVGAESCTIMIVREG